MAPRFKVVIATCVGLAMLTGIVGSLIAIRVLDSADASRQRASDRITSLQTQINTLDAALQTSIVDRASLHTAVDALSAQIRQMGGTPVASATPTTSTTTPPTTQPPPATATTRCTVKLLDQCVG